jgi:hypothetical protein
MVVDSQVYIISSPELLFYIFKFNIIVKKLHFFNYLKHVISSNKIFTNDWEYIYVFRFS